MASDAPNRELIDTVAVHARWLRRDGLTDAHRVDNEQSADYLDRLAQLLVLVTGRLEPQPEITRPSIRAAVTLAYIGLAGDLPSMTNEQLHRLADGTQALLAAGATPEAEENRP